MWGRWNRRRRHEAGDFLLRHEPVPAVVVGCAHRGVDVQRHPAYREYPVAVWVRFVDVRVWSAGSSVMRTLTDIVPFPLAVSGRHGYWGASPKLEEWTHELIDALAAGEPTEAIVWQIGDELFNERAPTPDQMNFDEDAHWARQRQLQQALWESQGGLHAWNEVLR